MQSYHLSASKLSTSDFDKKWLMLEAQRNFCFVFESQLYFMFSLIS